MSGACCALGPSWGDIVLNAGRVLGLDGNGADTGHGNARVHSQVSYPQLDFMRMLFPVFGDWELLGEVTPHMVSCAAAPNMDDVLKAANGVDHEAPAATRFLVQQGLTCLPAAVQLSIVQRVHADASKPAVAHLFDDREQAYNACATLIRDYARNYLLKAAFRKRNKGPLTNQQYMSHFTEP